MSIKISLAAIGAVMSLGLFATSGNAATITDAFSIIDSSSSVIADGSFSYDSSLSGQLGYGDLTAFSFHVPATGNTYNFAFVNSVSNYVYFAYDTMTNMFVGSPTLSGTGGTGFFSFLSATNDDFTGGFFVATADTVRDYNGGTWVDHDYANISITQVSQTPIPAALSLFASALAGLGLVGWRGRKASAA